MQHGLAHCFAGDGACVDAHATNDLAPFNERNLFTAFRALNRGALAGRAGTDHNQVVLRHR